MKHFIIYLLSFIIVCNASHAAEKFPLHIAASNGDIDRMIELMSSGMDIDSQSNHFEETPLHCAIENNQLRAAILLLLRGANPNSQDIFGETPLHRTVVHCNIELAKLLLKHGANTNYQNKDGDTPVKKAARLGYEIIEQKIKKYMAKNEDTCPICLEDAALQRSILHNATPCCHRYICGPCMDKQMVRKHQCPLCISIEGWK